MKSLAESQDNAGKTTYDNPGNAGSNQVMEERKKTTGKDL